VSFLDAAPERIEIVEPIVNGPLEISVACFCHIALLLRVAQCLSRRPISERTLSVDRKRGTSHRVG